MKNNVFILILVAFVFIGCSNDTALLEPTQDPIPKDKGDDTPKDEDQIPLDGDAVKKSVIVSFSSNFGRSGEILTITGDNFPLETGEINISFDGIRAEIIASSATVIKLKLPVVNKTVPTLSIVLKDQTINHSIITGYQGNIGILPAKNVNVWTKIKSNSTPNSINGTASKVQMLNDDSFYYTVTASNNLTSQVFRTIDGGITWSKWSDMDPLTSFYVTSKNEGWVGSKFLIQAINAAGVSTERSVPSACIAAYYINDDMRNGIYVADDGNVGVTTDGGRTFTTAYTSSINFDEEVKGVLKHSYVLNQNNIWATGYKLVGNSSFPHIVYKSNGDDWAEVTLNTESGSKAEDICFVNTNVGFLSTSRGYLYKTTNGGKTWERSNSTKGQFVFKSENEGWYILNEKIYKTVNGGESWVVDKISDDISSFLAISFRDNVIWAVTETNTYKYYFQ